MARSVLLKVIADVAGAQHGIRETSDTLKKFGSLRESATADVLLKKGAEAKLTRLHAQLERLRKQPTSAAVDIRIGNTVRQIQRVERELGQVGVKAEEAAVKANRAGGLLRGAFSRTAGVLGAVGATYGLARAIDNVAQGTVGFDRAMHNVNAIAHLSERSLAGLSRQVLALSRATGQGPEDLAKGLYDLISAGKSSSDAMHILRVAAHAAVAGLTDTKTSTGALISVLNAYHLPASRAAEVSDTLFQTVRLGKTTFGELADTIGEVTAFAAPLGVDIRQVGAAFATLTREGVLPHIAITKLRQLIVSFEKPTKGMQEGFHKLGTTGEELLHKRGLQGALEALRGTTDGSSAALAKMFPNIRALGAATLLTGKNVGTAHNILKQFGETSGQTSKAFREQAKSVSFQWDKARQELHTAEIELGTKLAPTAVRALHSITRFVEQIRSGTGAGGRFADRVRGIASALGRVVSFLSRHKTAIATAIGAWALYRTAAAIATGAARARLIRMFLGLGPRAAAGGLIAGEQFGTTASRTASRRMGRFPWGGLGRSIGTVLGIAIAYEIEKHLPKAPNKGQGVADRIFPLQPRPFTPGTRTGPPRSLATLLKLRAKESNATPLFLTSDEVNVLSAYDAQRLRGFPEGGGAVPTGAGRRRPPRGPNTRGLSSRLQDFPDSHGTAVSPHRDRARGGVDPAIARFLRLLNEPIKQTSDQVAGLGDASKVTGTQLRALRLGVQLASHAYAKAVQKYGADSDQAHRAEVRLINARTSLARAEQGKTTKGPAAATGGTLDRLREAQRERHLQRTIERFGKDSPQAKRERLGDAVLTARETVRTDRRELNTAVRKFGEHSEKAVRAHVLLIKAQTRLREASDALKGALVKNVKACGGQLFPKPTDIARPVTTTDATSRLAAHRASQKRTDERHAVVNVGQLVMPKTVAPIGDPRYDATKLHGHLRALGAALPT